MDNVLGGGHFGFVKEGVLLRESSSPDDGEEKIPVAVKSLKSIYCSLLIAGQNAKI
jgi:hypothetical protein